MKVHIRREIIINKSNDEVYKIISNFHNWNKWSPWFHMEPSSQTEIGGTPHMQGQFLNWNGQVIGTGRMTLERLTETSEVEVKLQFYSPHKSTADSRFEIKNIGDGKSLVVWSMNSEIPFFLFFLKKMMEVFMGNDFERGLNMLKELCENGCVASQSVNQGERNLNGFQVLGKKVSCKVSDLSVEINAVFNELNSAVENGKIEKTQTPLSLTHDFNFEKGTCVLTVGFGYPLEQKVPPMQGFECLKFPAHRAFIVDHYGAYRNLRNPWALAMGCQRQQKMKISKTVPVYEKYLNSPHGITEAEIYTQIVIPLKS